ncbi:hypothetical protein [Modestobacter sp. URMC 112]
MADFTVGDTVPVTGTTMTGNVGTVVHIDGARGRYLVRVSDPPPVRRGRRAELCTA